MVRVTTKPFTIRQASSKPCSIFAVFLNVLSLESRKKQKVKKESKAETYEELVAKRDKAEAQIKALEKEIEEKRKQGRIRETEK